MARATERSPLLLQAPESHAHKRRKYVLRVVGVLLLAAALGWLFSRRGKAAVEAKIARFRHPSSSAQQNYSTQELLTLQPPFVAHKSPLPPRMRNRSVFPSAMPTNAFWTNLLVGDDHGLNPGSGPVTLNPYTVRSLPKRLEVSYGDSRRVATNLSVTEYFNVDAAFTGYSRKSSDGLGLGEGNATFREVVAFDPLSVTVQYHFTEQSAFKQDTPANQSFLTRLVRGDPYVTVEYAAVIPVLELNATLLSVNGDAVDEVTQWTASRFELTTQVYGAERGLVNQTWLLYFAQERTLQLQVANEKDYRGFNLRGEIVLPTSFRLVDADFYTGAARLAIVPGDSEAAAKLLDAHADVYPVASSVQTQADADDTTGVITLCWETKTLGNASSAAPLLLLAHPHHVDSFATQQDDAAFQVLAPLGHRTVKGNMTAVTGSCWRLQETLPTIGFGTNVSIIEPELVQAIIASLHNDSNYTPKAQDPYYFGKEVARQARLTLIADTVNETAARDELLDQLETLLTPWLMGENKNRFVYDAAWGGICSRNGLKGVFFMSDFGNGWYNDHHFHYGYFIYSVAVLVKYRPEFGHTHSAAILSLVRDIASFDPEDSHFPFTRHFSWFDGHSFASGVYTLDGGKSQESVSEAINAYYGVYLLGKAMQLPAVERIGRLLTAMESRAAQTYWQMPASSQIYEPIFAANKMTGQVASTKVSYTTWFGPEIEHMHLINMMPFTPITERFLTPTYVAEEYPILQHQAFERQVDPIDKRWRGYAYLVLAMIHPAQAWKDVQALDFFDDGNSLTSSLFWIATRPAATNASGIPQ